MDNEPYVLISLKVMLSLFVFSNDHDY